MFAYTFSIYVSIYYLQTSETKTSLVAFSCLFLDFKFLSFFRFFESYNMYFTIIVKVAEKLIFFLGFLIVIIVGFAHAFFILLRPKSVYSLDEPTNNDDPNNPWNLVPSYYQTLEDGTITSNKLFVQAPDDGTNMFTDYGNALYATYLFLMGNDLFPSRLKNIN